jgi:hypothetical protein
LTMCNDVCVYDSRSPTMGPNSRRRNAICPIIQEVGLKMTERCDILYPFTKIGRGSKE